LQLLLQVKVILVSLLNSWHWRAWLVFWRENSWLILNWCLVKYVL
jgi:hypothetical protein